MKVFELIQTTKELLPEDVRVIVHDAQILRYLNIAYEQVAQYTYILRTGYSASVVNEKVSLPPYIIAVFTAKWSDGSNSSDVSPIYWSEAISFLGNGIYSPPVGTPRFMVVFSPTYVVLYPKPSLGGTVEGVAAVLPHPEGTILPLTNLEQEPQFSPAFHDILAYYAAASLLIPYPHHVNQARLYSETFFTRALQLKEHADDFTMKPVSMYPPMVRGTFGIVGIVS